MRNSAPIYLLLLLVVVILLGGCADSQHQVKPCVTGYEYGFFSGAWHGAVAPIALVGSWCSDNIAIYAVNNNGGWYDFGYIIGIVGMIKLFVIVLHLIIAFLEWLCK